MEKNGSAVGAALINEFKQMVADGRLPQVDMSQFKNAEELAAYLVNAIRSGGEAVVNAVRTAVPHDPTKKAAAFMVTRKDGEQADGPDGEAEEPENGGDFGDSDPMEREDVRDALSKIDDQLDTAEKMYHGLVRERCFIHGVRDLPDMDNPDHLMSMVDTLNRLEDVGERICNVQRKLSVLGIVYGLSDSGVIPPSAPTGIPVWTTRTASMTGATAAAAAAMRTSTMGAAATAAARMVRTRPLRFRSPAC